MKHVLVCVDFSEITPRVLEVSQTLVAGEKGKLTLLHVAPPDPAYVGFEAGPQAERDAVAKTRREEHRAVQDLAEKVNRDGVEATALLVQGPTVKKIVEEARRLKVDAIVLGSHGHGAMYDLLVGSATKGVLKQAHRPVVVVPAEESGDE